MKRLRTNEPASRREFLRDGARYALLAGLGAVSATLAKRSGVQLTGQTCINQGICRGCTAFADCGLPQALSAKEFRSLGNRRLPHQGEAAVGEEAQPSRKERGVHAASAPERELTVKRTKVRALEANHET